MNKKGDFQSTIFAILFLFAAGVVLLLFNHMFSNIYSQVDVYFDDSEFNNTEAHQALNEIQTVEQTIWDYAFLGIAISYILLLGFTAFTTRLHPMFFWVYVIVAIFGLMLAVMLSNTWQEMAANPELADTIARFPITNTMLGTIFPVFVLGLITIVMILMFGKFPGDAQ